MAERVDQPAASIREAFAVFEHHRRHSAGDVHVHDIPATAGD